MKKLLFLLAAVVLATAALAVEVVLQPGAEGKDAHIRSQGPTSNYGSYAYLTVNWSPAQESRGLVEFNLSTIPSGANITSAILELYTYTNNPNDNFAIYRITATWDEMAVTWSNQPAHAATAYATTLVQGAGTYSWNITTLVQEWVNNTYPNYGFKLIRPSALTSSWPYFASSDHATYAHPKLTVNYTMTGVAPSSLGRVKALYQ
jgi:hypothetical protein